MIKYKTIKTFTNKQLQNLFLSVNWESGNYPDKLVKAMQNSTHVISAWDNDELIGLVRAIDDGETIAFIHYLLVNPKYQGQHIGDELMRRILENFKDILYVKFIPSAPKTINFYKRYGFQEYDNYSAMVIKQF